MSDRPRPDTDDATSSFSPAPSGRPRWVDQGWGAPTSSGPDGTPGTGTLVWYEPARQPGEPVLSSPAGRRVEPAHDDLGDGRRRSGLGIVGVIAVAVLSGAAGALLTIGVLGAGGHLVSPGTSLPATPLTAGTQQAPVVTRIEQSDLIAAINRISPAVVTIVSGTGIGATTSDDPSGLPATGVGSGIIFSADQGLALTTRHVVCGAGGLTVRLADGRVFPGTMYGIDTLTDLAIVRLGTDGEDLPVARVGDSTALQAGQVAIAIGAPLGSTASSVSSGVVSATGRDVSAIDRCGGAEHTLHNLIQTDAAIHGGNSGGPLVDASGRMIGISTAAAGDGAAGVGYAVPVNIARPIMDQAIAGLTLTRPWIGIAYEPVTPTVMARLGLPLDYGVLVRAMPGDARPAVDPDGPAARGGVLEGDVITAINEERIDATHPLDDLLAQYRPDDPLTLAVLRDGRTITLRVVLGTRPASL